MLKFKKLNLDDRSEYLSKYSQFPPYADYYFNNLFSWLGKKDEVYLAYHNEGVVLRFINPFNEKSDESYTVLAEDSALDIVKYLFGELGVSSLDMVPSVTVSSLFKSGDNKNSFKQTLDRDNCDYVYNARNLAHMLGPKSKGFLRQVNTFLKRHSAEVVVRSIDLKNNGDRASFINQIHRWEMLYTKNDLERSEAIALDNYMRYSEFLDPMCLGVYIGGKLEAFTIYAYPPQKDFMILSHAKSSYAFPGLFDFLIYSTVSRAVADNKIKYMNFEQDLGIEGLRQHKTLMKPVFMLEKFTLEPVKNKVVL